MNIEEKIKNAEDLFRNYYLAKGSEGIKISSHVLEENGLGGKDFGDIVCPALEKNGVLKSYRSSLVGGLAVPEDCAHPEQATQLDASIRYETIQLSHIQAENGFMVTSVSVPGYTNESRLAAETRIREKQKEIDDLIAKRASLEKIYSFEVNADYFKHSVISSTSEKSLKSIHLVTDLLEPSSTIFLVLDERFNAPIRCAVNNKKGHPTYIKKLYDIGYFVDVPGKSVPYTERSADDINNGLFKIKGVSEYMRTNKLRKPTLVQKSGKILALKNEIVVKTELIKNIPTQYKSLYIDKTR